MVEQPDDNDHQGRLLWCYQQTQEENWDSYGASPTTEDAFYQTQMMIMLMEATFDPDMLDRFFVVPISGGFCIEYVDPHYQPKSTLAEEISQPMSSFDTTIDAQGSVSFWRSQNLSWTGTGFSSDFEFDSDVQLQDASNADVIEAWMTHARAFQTFVQETHGA